MKYLSHCHHGLILGLLLVTVGCDSTPPAPTHTLVYGRGGDAQALDPIHTDVGESVKVLVNVFENLVTYDEETLDLVPCLATEWTTSDDGLQWTFTLREGVRFHDGTPLNADAVVFTFERILDPNHPHVYSQVIPYYGSYQGIDKVHAIDEQTVRFTLKEPKATFLANVAMFSCGIVSPTAVEKYGKEFVRNPVGTGPFRFEEWKQQQRIVLSRFEDYWREPAGVERVVFVPTKESVIRVTQLRRGEIHIADNLPPAQVDILEKSSGVKVQSISGMNVGYITMQTEKPPLDKKLVRQAICHAVDIDRLIETAYSGHALKATTIVPKTLWGHNDAISARAFDREKASEMLRQAAKEHGFELPVKLQLFVMDQPRPYMQQPRQTAIFLKDSLEKVGFEIEIVTNDINQHFQRMTRGEHELGLSGWSADIADPDNFLHTLLHSDNINELGGNNMSQYRNDEVDKLLSEAQTELDREKRIELYHQAQVLIHDDAPVLPLVHAPVRVAMRDWVEGYQLHPSALVRLRRAKLVEK